MEGKSSRVDKEALTNVIDDDLNDKGSRICSDVWKDQGILYRLQRGEFLPNITSQKRDRIVHRVARFHWENGLMFWRWQDGTRRVVPKPEQCLQLI